jgi:hypothetical protein
MPVNRKVIAAIAAAVGEFLQAEQVLPAPAVGTESRPPATPPVLFSPWALSGRQSMMDMRRFLQMRLAR